MLSLISRLRGERHGRTTEEPPTIYAGIHRVPTAAPAPGLILDRPIVANPNDLLDPDEQEEQVAQGLMPPRATKRAVVERTPIHDSDDLEQPTSHRLLDKDKISTFGRHNTYGTPPQAPRSNSPTFSVHGDPSISASGSPENTSSSQYDSALSNQSPNQTRSSMTRSTRSVRSRSARRTAPHDSPHTFGKPSPSLRTRSHGGSVSASPPPPLPPFDHPELVSAISSRAHSRSRTFGHSTTSHFQSDNWVSNVHGTTYPTHERSKTDNEARDFAMLPTFGRSLRSYASLPKVQNVFRASDLQRESIRRRTRTTSARRTSAEWNAQQAAAGVTSLLPSEFGWPAEVAQQMVAMSLGQVGEGAVRARDAGEFPADAEPRATRSESAWRCYPSRLIPLQSPPSFALLEESSGGRDLSLSRRYTTAKNLRERDHSRMAAETDVDVTASTPRKTTSNRVPRKGKARTRRVSHTSWPNHAASTSQVLQPSRSSSLHNTPLAPASASTSKTTSRPARPASEPRLESVLKTPKSTKGKRKADDIEVTPPDSKNGHHTTFAIPPEARRSQHISETSRPPSSYYRKRPRLSDPSTPTPSPARPRPASAQKPSATGSWPSRSSIGPPQSLSHVGSRSTSTRSAHRAESTTADRRRSLSERSIPISALIAPHAPSLSRSNAYPMHDPRKPPKPMPTAWALRFKSEDEEGSPLQAWCFFIGFILFPIWWAASFSPVPKTREVGGTDTEKAVTLDDPQVERDARAWRNRCRIMSGISFLTYIPFIVLVAVFVPR